MARSFPQHIPKAFKSAPLPEIAPVVQPSSLIKHPNQYSDSVTEQHSDCAKANNLAGPLAQVLAIRLIFLHNKHPPPLHAIEQAILA